MLRSFRPQDFIQLPIVGEAGALTLVDELEAAAKAAPKLPSAVYAALGRVLEVAADLQKSILVREKAGSSADPRARAADRALDDAWGAFQSWLMGWTRLPDRAHEKVPLARALYALIFPKGLQFLTLDFKNEWKESQERLDVIASQHQDALIGVLGGAPFLHTISRAHKVYGDALHITGTNGSHNEPDTAVRASLENIHMALRDYVAQVAATVRRTENDTVDLAAQLLAPLSDRSVTEVDMDETVQSLYD